MLLMLYFQLICIEDSSCCTDKLYGLGQSVSVFNCYYNTNNIPPHLSAAIVRLSELLVIKQFLREQSLRNLSLPLQKNWILHWLGQHAKLLLSNVMFSAPFVLINFNNFEFLCNDSYQLDFFQVVYKLILPLLMSSNDQRV